MNIKRRHLFEFEDLSWFPDSWRKYITEILTQQINSFRVYEPIVPLLEKVIRETNHSQVFDLCSGSSGPILSIMDDIRDREIKVAVTLTDKYPNTKIFETIHKQSQGKIEFIRDSVDAISFPRNLRGVRTLFSSFHHFKPQQAKAILQAAVDDEMPICIFEFTERKLANFLKVILFGLPLVWLTTPLVRPFKFSRLFWTYLIPVVPVIYCWDAFVSHLRTYTTEELKQMIAAISDDNSYHWELGKVKSPKSGFTLTYVVGYKSDSSQSRDSLGARDFASVG